ncbi:hypothetical protein BB560_006418, partial [Smittium megazygosporum]
AKSESKEQHDISSSLEKLDFRIITNNATPDSLILLSGLKSIFQRQLPNMSGDYIARLVFDRF